MPCLLHVWTRQPAWWSHHAVDRALPSRFASMCAITITKSQLQRAVRHQCACQVIPARFQHSLGPSIFHTTLLIGWKGQRVTARPDTLKICISVHPVQFGRNSATYNNSHGMLCPRHAVWHAQNRDKGIAFNPNEKMLQYTPITKCTRYIAGVGPLIQHQ